MPSGGSMNIYVFVKRVPDTESKIRIDHDQKSVIEEGLSFILSPYDEYAVEEALKLKDAKGGKVTVISVGPEEALVVLKKCLAMGADEAVLVKDEVPETYDGLRISKIIAQAVRKKFVDYDLLFFGRQSVGADNSQVPSMVAELLDLPQVNVVTELEIDGNNSMAHREVEGALEKVEFSLPAVISAQKGLNEPRSETLKGIMMAKRKEIPIFTIEELELREEDIVSQLQTIKIESPPPKQAGTIIDDEPAVAARKLAEHLRDEAKVI
jgi:electron transfer flavoprotein beta subunit